MRSSLFRLVRGAVAQDGLLSLEVDASRLAQSAQRAVSSSRAIGTLTGVGSESKFKGLWPPKDPEGDWQRSQERIAIVLKNNPPPKHKPWEVHHDDHHDDHG